MASIERHSNVHTLIYADIVHESGFAQTLVDSVSIPAGLASIGTSAEAAAVPPEQRPAKGDVSQDLDDSWAELLPLGRSRSQAYELPGGRTVQGDREGESLTDEETTLCFSIAEADGPPARLEPYMGMLSHAAVTRDNGSVFVHLHPSGSINMAAQLRFEREEGGGAGHRAGYRMDGMGQPEELEPTGETAFPFVFPGAGPYRIFVQFKIDGEVETAVVDLDVRAR